MKRAAFGLFVLLAAWCAPAFAMPVVEGLTTDTGGGAAVTSITLTKPAGVVPDDLLVILVNNEDNTNSTTFNALSGWTKAFEAGNSSTDVKIAMYWRVADGTEGGSETVTVATGNDYIEGWYLRVSGVDTANPIPVVGAGDTTTGNSTSLVSTGVTTTGSDSLALSMIAHDGGDGFPFSVSGTGWPGTIPANQQLQVSGATNTVHGAWVTKAMPSSGPTQDVTWTTSGAADGLAANQFVIQGAAPTGTLVAFTSASQTSAAETGTMTVTAQLSQTDTVPVTVPFTVTGTATDPDDYTITASPIVIPAGSLSADITITITDDSIDENEDETVVVTLGTPTNASAFGTTVHTATITDDDVSPAIPVVEGFTTDIAGNLAVTSITLTQPAGVVPGDLLLLLVNNEDNTNTTTFNALSGWTKEFEVGNATQDVKIALYWRIADGSEGASETITVATGTDYIEGWYVRVSGADTTNPIHVVGAGDATSGNSTSLVSSGLTTSIANTLAFSMVAHDGGDGFPFSLSGTGWPATIPANQELQTSTATNTVSGAWVTKSMPQPGPTRDVTWGVSGTGDGIVANQFVVAAAPLPTVTFATAAQASAGESGTLAVTAQLSATSGSDVTVPYTVTGTASDPADYTITASPLVIPAGSTSADITVTIAGDAMDENDETVVVTMGTPSGATLGATTVHTATITDDDPAPSVQFTSAAQASANESGTLTATLQLSAASSFAVSVPYTVSGTASDPADYSITASPAVISAGSTSADITVTIAADTLSEGDETVVIDLGTPTNAGLGATVQHTATITDDDAVPTVQFTSATQASGGEAGTMTVTVQLSATSAQDVTVPFTVTGTAADPADYTIAPNPLVISAGSTSADITITIASDTLDETDETVVVTMGTPVNATQGGVTVHTATISDDDAAPTVTFTSAGQASASESGTMTVTAQLSTASGRPVSVPYTMTGTAGSPADYTATPSPAVIPAGSLSADITITINGDALDEADETVVVTMGTPVNATQGATTVHTATITDDDAAPTVQFAAASQASAGETGTMTATLQLSAASGLPVSVPYTVTGTASDPADYTVTASPAVIPAGSTTADVTITIVGDTITEGDETVIVTLGTPTNGTLGATTVHTATITDDEGILTVDFTSASQASAGETGTMTVTAQLSGTGASDVTVPFTVTGTAADPADYTITASPLVISAGSLSADITLTIAADTLDENDETVVVTMGTPTGANPGAVTVHTATISDDDAAPTVQFTSASQASAGETGTMTATVQLSTASGLPVSVPFTVTGSANNPNDFTVTASPAVIPAGSNSADVTITIAGDGLDENDETVVLTLGTPTNGILGAASVHTATITDDDAAPTVDFTAATQASAGETGTLTATIQLSAASGLTVTVPYTVGGTAADPADYTVTASPAVFTPGSTTADVTITIAGDALDEADETVVLTLGTPTNGTLGATTVHTATITDDDAAPTVTFTSAAQASAVESGTMTVTAQLSAASGRNVSVPYTLSGTGLQGTDYTIDASPAFIPAGSTTANVTITILDDAITEPDETVIVTMGTPTNATQGATTVHTATITDDEGLLTVNFTAASQASAGETGTMTVTAQLSATSASNVTVPFTVTGTAADPADYTISASPLVISAGSLSADITITIAGDTLDESDETVVVTMGTPVNATQGGVTVHTATISDDDAAPTVTFTSAGQASAGESGTMTVTAQLSTASGRPVSVPYTVTGTAGTPADYTVTPSPALIPAGSTTVDITVTVNGDTIDEADETVVVTMGTPVNATQGATTVHIATITDDDAAPTVDFTAASQASANETGTLTATIQLSAASGLAVTVPYTVGGTASDPADYTLTASPAVIPAGSTTADVTITIAGDALDEADETVVLTLGTPTNGTLGATTVHTATITDDDATPTVSFTSAAQASAGESGAMTVTAQLSAASGLTVSVPFTLSGTATNPADYTITASPVVVPAGSSTADITITIVGDALTEGDETVVVTMGTPTNATLGPTTVHTATITDDEGALTVAFTAAAQASAGESGTLAVTAQLNATGASDVTVPFTVTGTAADPADYTISASPLVIPAGSLSADITITITGDTVDENDETVVVTMGSPAGAAAGATTVHTATITDDDPTPTVQFTSSAQASAGESGTLTATVQLSAASSFGVSVPFTVGGTASDPADYTITASPVFIPAGGTSAAITLTIAPDGLSEGNETVILNLGTPTGADLGATSQHTATITDDDGLPAVQFTSASQTSTDESGTMVATIQLSAVAGFNVTVPYTVAGSAKSPADYTVTASPAVIPAGSTSADVTVTIAADTIEETNETVTLTLGTPTNGTLGATTVHTATITDDDAAPTVTFTSSSQTSGDESGTMTVTIQLSAASGLDVTVPYSLSGTAQQGSDYSISANPVVLPAGSTIAGITISIVADAITEGDETVVVSMGTPTGATQGATTVHTATIHEAEVQPGAITIPSGGFVTFDGAQSLSGDGTPSGLTYEWDFDYDGAFVPEVTAPVVANTFNTLGSHTVALRVTDAYGKNDMAMVEVTVTGGGTQGARKAHVLNVDTDVDQVLVGTSFGILYGVLDQQGIPLEGLLQADFPTSGLVLTNQATATQLSAGTDYVVGALTEPFPGRYRQAITLLPGAPVMPGDLVVADVRLVGITPLSDARGATDGRTVNGATEFQVAGGGAAPSGLFQHVVLQPASPTLGPAAGTFSLGVRFYDQDGARYAPSSTGNLQVVSAVNQDGIDYTPWTNPANVITTYDGATGTYNVSWAGLTGSVLGDRLYVTLRHQLESGYVVDFSFGIEIRNVPAQQATNPRYAAPDFP